MGIKELNPFIRKKSASYQLTKIHRLISQFNPSSPFLNTKSLEQLEQLIAQSTDDYNQWLQQQIRPLLYQDPVFQRRDLNELRGTRIAIDANNWGFRQIATLQKASAGNIKEDEFKLRRILISQWLRKLVDDIMIFLKHGIRPLFVFDGKPPEAKEETRKERIQRKENIRAEIKELRTQLKQTEDPFDLNPESLQRLRKLEQQNTFLTREELNVMKEILVALGIPLFESKGEAEKLCSLLAIEGKVSAVYSVDTDNLVYGCPLLITEIKRNGDHYEVLQIEKDKVLEVLSLDYDKFRDFCIMLGCDYNKNMPGIGPVKAYQLIQQYGRIEQLPPQYPRDILQYEQCREIFSYCHSSLMIQSGYIDIIPELPLQSGALAILERYQLAYVIPDLLRMYDNLPPIREECPCPPKDITLTS